MNYRTGCRTVANIESRHFRIASGDAGENEVDILGRRQRVIRLARTKEGGVVRWNCEERGRWRNPLSSEANCRVATLRYSHNGSKLPAPTPIIDVGLCRVRIARRCSLETNENNAALFIDR